MNIEEMPVSRKNRATRKNRVNRKDRKNRASRKDRKNNNPNVLMGGKRRRGSRRGRKGSRRTRRN
jgi:hypothetical protein